MTAYRDRERRDWRALMLALLVLALLLVPNVAEAGTVVCRNGTEPGFYRGGKRTVAVCYVYRGPRGARVLP